MRRDTTGGEEAERLWRLRDDFGFDAFKWRVGAECGHDVDQWPGRTEEIVPAVARALGADVAKLVDANGGFSPGRAIEVGRLLEAEGGGHFEEPCPYWRVEETKRVADALTIDVARREQDRDLATWQRVPDVPGGGLAHPEAMYQDGLCR